MVEQPKVNDATMQQLFDPLGLNSSLEEQKLDNIDNGITNPVPSKPLLDDNSLNQEPEAPKFTAEDWGITDVQVSDTNPVDNGIVDIKPDEEVISEDNSITKSSLKNPKDESLDDKAKVVEVAPVPEDIKAMLNLGNNVTPKEPVMPDPIPGAPESPSTFLNKKDPVQTLEPKEEDAPIFVIPNEVTAISNPSETLTSQNNENTQTLSLIHI